VVRVRACLLTLPASWNRRLHPKYVFIHSWLQDKGEVCMYYLNVMAGNVLGMAGDLPVDEAGMFKVCVAVRACIRAVCGYQS
jgi:hypothetical protein